MSSLKAKVALVLSFFLGVILDQGIKYYVEHQLGYYAHVPILSQHWVVLSKSMNSGLLGDIYSKSAFFPRSLWPTLYGPALIWLAALGFAYARKNESAIEEKLGYALLLAGGASNLADYAKRGGVLDTFQVQIWTDYFVPFNLADVAISAGTGLILLRLIAELIRGRPKQMVQSF